MQSDEASAKLLHMWVLPRCSLVLATSLLLVSSAASQDRLAALDGFIVKVSDSKSKPLTLVRSIKDARKRYAHGVTEPVLSPDAKYVAFVEDGKAQIAAISRGTMAPPETFATSKPGSDTILSVDVMLIGFTNDSKSLLYFVTPGPDPCPDCPHHKMQKQPADYGYYFFDVSTKASKQFNIPGDWRVQDVIDNDRLFVTHVGSYGDEMGILRLSDSEFKAFPARCAQAYSCELNARATTASCVNIDRGKAQLVECGLSGGTVQSRSEVASCPTEFHQPLRSPMSKTLAYILNAGCNGKTQSLVVAGKPVLKCEALTRIGWVDERRLLAHCGDELNLVTIEGRKLGTMPAPRRKAIDED